MRWLPVIMVVVYTYLALPEALAGDVAMGIVYAATLLGSLALLMLSPVTRPKSMARALEASKRVVASQDD